LKLINNVKQLWCHLNRICSTKNNCNVSTVINKLIVDGVELFDSDDICNSMNNYFCNIGANLVKLLPTTSVHHSSYDKDRVMCSLFCEPVTDIELYRLVNLLNINKAAGPDDVRPQLVKDNIDYLCQPLVYLYNLSLKKG